MIYAHLTLTCIKTKEKDQEYKLMRNAANDFITSESLDSSEIMS